MIALDTVPWPPAPVKTERLVLRASEARDRTAFIELLASPEVHTYLGGPRPRDEIERELPEVPERWPGSFVVELDGSMIGQILLRRATGHRLPAAAGKADLGYLFLPRAWGFGYAAEACAAALGWFDGVLPGEPVVLTTQSANVASMRLRRSWGSPRWSGSRPGTPSSGSGCGPRSRRPPERSPCRNDLQVRGVHCRPGTRFGTRCRPAGMRPGTGPEPTRPGC